MRKRSFHRSLSGPFIRVGGAAPRLVILVGTSSVVMGPPMYPYGSIGGSVSSPIGSTSLCRCIFSVFYALSKRRETSSPR